MNQLHYSKLPLSAKIMLPLLATFLSMWMLGILGFGYFVSNLLRSNSEKELQDVASFLSSKLEHHHQMLHLKTESFAQREDIIEALETQKYPQISKILSSFKNHFNLDYIRLVDNNALDITLGDTIIHQFLVNNKNRNQFNKYQQEIITITNKAGEKTSILVQEYPIISGDKQIGSILVGLTIDKKLLEDIIATTKFEIIVTYDSQVIASSLPEVKDFSLPNNSPFTSLKIENKAYITYSKTFSYQAIKPLTAIILNPQNSLKEAQNKLWLFLGGFSIVGGASSTFLGIIIIRSHTYRLAVLNQGMLQLTQGKLNTQIQMNGDDEISRLALGFNIMAQQIAHHESQNQEQIKQQKITLDTLQKAQKEAESASIAKSQFLANMSHELRTPLNAILGFTQVLARDINLNSQQQKQLEIIGRSGEHLLELINDILEMSKIEADEVSFNQSSFDFYYLIKSLQEMLKLKAEAKNLQFMIEHNHKVPQYIKTDEGKLRQVLINLLGNAIKFTEEGGVTLRIKYRIRDKKSLNKANANSPNHLRLYFAIEDTGLGIAPDEIEQLFAAFGQTETGRKSEEGTGLGLPISQKFVNLMGGEIAVSSKLGRGSIFSFDIPVEIALASEVGTHQTKRKIIGLAPGQPEYRILAVDDRAESRMVLVQLLTPLGFDVREAANGQEAVDIWQDWHPHLIWMDMRMPVMDGYEATKKIKSHIHGQATAIIALTASAFEEERAVILSAGCDDFLRKPFRVSELLEKIAEHLGVVYIYEESYNTNLNNDSSPEALVRLTPAHLEVMSVEWLNQICQAAEMADDSLLMELIEQIPDKHTPVKTILQDWMNQFRFDKISDITQAALEKNH